MFVRLTINNALSRDENESASDEKIEYSLGFSYESASHSNRNAVLPVREYSTSSSVVFAEGDEFDMFYNPKGYYTYDFEDKTHFKILKISPDSITIQIFNAKEGTLLYNYSLDPEKAKADGYKYGYKELQTDIFELNKDIFLSFSTSSSDHTDNIRQSIYVDSIFEKKEK